MNIQLICMHFSFFVARRYLFAKKSHSAINIISWISLVGVAVGTMALIVILSVFNGFDQLIQSLYNSFDPDLKITIREGKVFDANDRLLNQIKKHPAVLYYSETLEDNALLKYRDKQNVAVIKGVDDAFFKVSGIDHMMTEGKMKLPEGDIFYGIVGQGIAYYLSINTKLYDPLQIYVPRRTASLSGNPDEAFNRKYIYPSGVFSIQQDYDIKYVIVPLSFARDLFEYTNQISAVEIKLKPVSDMDKVQGEIKKLAGSEYLVKNRYQQQELFYKIMKSEKWAIFFILTFILIVASFNIIGSLTMLIIDKKKDIKILNSLGAEWKQVRKIFLYEGWLISTIGAVIGLFAGIFICWLQIHFKLVPLQGNGSFIIDYYPVELRVFDFMSVFITVSLIGFLASWLPIRFIMGNLSKNN